MSQSLRFGADPSCVRGTVNGAGGVASVVRCDGAVVRLGAMTVVTHVREWSLALLVALVSVVAPAPGSAQELSDEEFQRALTQLADGTPDERAVAADQLGRRAYGRRDRLVPVLRERLRDDRDWRVRASAGRALGRLNARDAMPDLVRALRDPVVDVRVVAAAAIWRLPDPAAVPALTQLLTDQDAAARQWGALALGVIRDRRATQPLLNLLNDAEGGVRLDTIRSLGRIRDPGAVDGLRDFALDDARVDEERLEAIDSLASLDGPEAVNALVRLARFDDAGIRARSVQALGRVGDALVIPTLRERRRSETSAVVRNAIETAIQEIQDRAAGRPSGATNVPLNLPPLPE
jgi:HEAT repeat protein